RAGHFGDRRRRARSERRVRGNFERLGRRRGRTENQRGWTMIILKSKAEIEAMRRAGQVVARAHQELRHLIRPGVTTQELDEFVAEFLASQGAEASFKGYQGFPASICASVNEVVVHGIPGPRRLRE